ncbi:MAG: mechanosensitive ion channel family protein [Bacilli bacterium]
MKIFGLIIPKIVYMPIIIIIIAIIINKIAQTVVSKTFDPSRKSSKFNIGKIKTIKGLLSNVCRYVIYIIAFLALLSVFGINATSIVAGLGVVSLVIGLALQDILKDVLVGVSILFEDQFSVGDLIEISGFKGEVLSIGLKTTRIQAYTGEIKIISNRNISEVINYSISKSLAVIDIVVDYDSKLDKVEKILLITSATIREKVPDLLSEVEVLGVQELSKDGVVIRITGKCKPAKHFEVQLQLLKEYRSALEKSGIKTPYLKNGDSNEK